MKKGIVADDWYPVYMLVDPAIASSPPTIRSAPTITISDEEWADYQRVEKEFDAWQEKLRDFQWPKQSAR